MTARIISVIIGATCWIVGLAGLLVHSKKFAKGEVTVVLLLGILAVLIGIVLSIPNGFKQWLPRQKDRRDDRLPSDPP